MSPGENCSVLTEADVDESECRTVAVVDGGIAGIMGAGV
jgi:hypothetical protein